MSRWCLGDCCPTVLAMEWKPKWVRNGLNEPSSYGLAQWLHVLSSLILCHRRRWVQLPLDSCAKIDRSTVARLDFPLSLALKSKKTKWCGWWYQFIWCGWWCQHNISLCQELDEWRSTCSAVDMVLFLMPWWGAVDANWHHTIAHFDCLCIKFLGNEFRCWLPVDFAFPWQVTALNPQNSW